GPPPPALPPRARPASSKLSRRGAVSSPSASASTIRSPSTRNRTSAQQPSREESPAISVISLRMAHRSRLAAAAQAPRRSKSPTLGGGLAPYPCVERNEENVKRLLQERDDRGTNARARHRKMCPDPADVSAP